MQVNFTELDTIESIDFEKIKTFMIKKLLIKKLFMIKFKLFYRYVRAFSLRAFS